jgi:hypothetical protein
VNWLGCTACGVLYRDCNRIVTAASVVNYEMESQLTVLYCLQYFNPLLFAAVHPSTLNELACRTPSESKNTGGRMCWALVLSRALSSREEGSSTC